MAFEDFQKSFAENGILIMNLLFWEEGGSALVTIWVALPTWRQAGLLGLRLPGEGAL